MKRNSFFFSDERGFYSPRRGLRLLVKKCKFSLFPLHAFGFVLTERSHEEKGAKISQHLALIQLCELEKAHSSSRQVIKRYLLWTRQSDRGKPQIN